MPGTREHVLRPRAIKFVHWPNCQHWRSAALWACVVATLFVFCYGGASWIASQHDYRVRLHFDFEMSTPYMPWMAVAYLSLNPMLVLAPLVLKTQAELRAYAGMLIAMIVAATPCFLVFPGDRRRETLARSSEWQSIADFAHIIALEHNYLPSLHVAFVVACAWIFARHGSQTIRALLIAWSAATISSTALLHQHYVLDVAAGALLGVAGVRLGYDRWTASALATTSGANTVSQSQRASSTVGLISPSFCPNDTQVRS
jgi:membrane-associated phospholipid phosphatase